MKRILLTIYHPHLLNLKRSILLWAVRYPPHILTVGMLVEMSSIKGILEQRPQPNWEKTLYLQDLHLLLKMRVVKMMSMLLFLWEKQMGALKRPLLLTSLLTKMGCLKRGRLHTWKILDLNKIACLEGQLFKQAQDPNQRSLLLHYFFINSMPIYGPHLWKRAFSWWCFPMLSFLSLFCDVCF